MCNFMTITPSDVRLRANARLEALAWEKEVEECFDRGSDALGRTARAHAEWWWDLARWGTIGD